MNNQQPNNEFDEPSLKGEIESFFRSFQLFARAALAALVVWLIWNQFGNMQVGTRLHAGSINANPVSSAGNKLASKAKNLPSGRCEVPPSIFDPAKHPNWRLKTLNIEDIRVGMRVPALNPQGIQSQSEASARDEITGAGTRAGRGSPDPAPMDITETAFGTPDPKTWRTFRLQVEKEDRTGDLEVTLLRPADWLVEQQQSTVLLAMLAEWQLADEETRESSAEIGFSSAVRVIDALTEFNPLDEMIGWLATGADFVGRTQPLYFTDPVRGLISFGFTEFESSIMEQAEADLAWSAAVDSVLSGDANGSQIWLEMPELGAVGLATVTAIEPCPTIKSGPGRIVTATFKHASAEVLDLRFASTGNSAILNSSSSLQPPVSSLSLGTTAAHPFWSVDRDDFIPAGELQLQEQVIGINGQHFRLTSITPRAGPETVYNFEVALDHVYYVGEGGVLVHNVYLTKGRWFTEAGKRISRGEARTLLTRQAKRRLQKLANEAREEMGILLSAGRLSADPKFLGKELERRVAELARDDELLKKYVKYAAEGLGTRGPDFIGKGILNGRMFEVTTNNIFTMMKHLERSRAPWTNHIFYPQW